jgi:hypothetical protein
MNIWEISNKKFNENNEFQGLTTARFGSILKVSIITSIFCTDRKPEFGVLSIFYEPLNEFHDLQLCAGKIKYSGMGCGDFDSTCGM